MKKVVLGVVVVAVLAGIVYSWRNSVSDEAEAAKMTLAKVERGPIEATVSTTGRVVPNLKVEIKCKASGRVAKLPFEISDTVKKGDLLVELDPVDEQRAVDTAKVVLQASQARLDQAKRNLELSETNLKLNRERAVLTLKTAEAQARDAKADYERARQSLREGIIPPQEMERAKTASIQADAEVENAKTQLDQLEAQEKALEVERQNVELAKAQVKQDEIRLQDAQQRLDDTKVYAPIDGVVAGRLVQEGMIISSGVTNIGGGTTVMTLADLTKVFVVASVDESDIGRVEVGQKVEITADAFPTKPFTGEVVRIATEGANSYNVVTFEVKIEVKDDVEQLLKPEMTTNVEILLDKKDNILRVPVETVWRKDRSHVATVVKPDGTKEEREVEVGITDGIYYEVLAGLQEGETLEARTDITGSRWSGGDDGKGAAKS